MSALARAFPQLPVLSTHVPGPASLRIAAAESALHSKGTSAASMWAALAIVEGQGAVVRDADGNYLLDACSGTVVMNIGHGDPRIADALANQAAQLTHYYDFPSPVRVEFLQALRQTLPPSFDSFHLTSSGSEAVEAALRIVRSATGRYEVLVFDNGYHGRTMGAISLTAGTSHQGIGPLLPGVVRVPSAYCFRCPVGRTYPDCAIACADPMDRALAQTLLDAPAAVVIEPMQGAGGMIPMRTEFLQRVRQFCDRTGALLVFDEILTGAGRTGKMWAFEHSGVVPDILLAGKGLAAGFPIGIVASRHEITDAGPIALPTRNSSTFGGGPLACAVGLACLEILTGDGLIENAGNVGDHLMRQLASSLRDDPHVGDIRGLGLAIGVELVEDRSSLAPMSADAAREVLLGLLRHGVITSSGTHVLRITPPLCLTIEQADFIVQSLVEVLSAL
jgi:4-aminobutyrate aminotransferase-like enzyme